MSSDADRQHALQFDDLESTLGAIDYPASTGEVREAVGDHEIEHPSGRTTVGEALSGHEDATFDSAEGVYKAIKRGLEGDAVGKEEYAERGGMADIGDADDDAG